MKKKIDTLKKQLVELEKKINAIDNADTKQAADDNNVEKPVEEVKTVEKTEEKPVEKTDEKSEKKTIKKEVAGTAEE